MKRRVVQVAIGALMGLVISAGVALVLWGVPGGRPTFVLGGPEAAGGAAAGGPQVGGPFELVDHTGRTVTDRDYAGRFLLVYFGFTYCPDICPTELQTFAEVMDRLGPAAERVQPLFVTIDPERDTPEVMAEYVAAFHPRLVGLTGSAEQITRAARAYRVFYAKVQHKPGDPYLMDHSTAVYLMGPDGRFETIFGRGIDPERITDAIRTRIARAG